MGDEVADGSAGRRRRSRWLARSTVALLLVGLLAGIAVARERAGGEGDVRSPTSAGRLPVGAAASSGGLGLDPRTAAGLGPLPAWYELHAPARRPRGVVLLVHGGAWRAVGPREAVQMRPEARRWLRRGWATANVDYRPRHRSLDDVTRAYDAIRRRVGWSTPVVVLGDSAGGHLSLLLAARRPGVSAVIARAAPTDPVRVAGERTWNPRLGRPSGAFPRVLARLWRSALGPRWRASWSPVRQASRIRVPVLLAGAVRDPLVPPAQARDLAAALRAAHPRSRPTVLRLGPGRVRFPHARIGVADDRRLQAAVDRLLRPWANGSPRTPPVVPGWWPAPRPDPLARRPRAGAA